MILTIANQKGGTAKSTTAAALAQAAAHRGKHCLAIDLDPQGNLSFFLAADTARAGAFEMLEGKPARETIQPTEWGIDTIAASWNLQTISSGRGSARRLKSALKPIAAQYDLIVIDTPPTAGELQYNALMASDNLIIPLQADIVGLQGLYQMAETIKDRAQEMGIPFLMAIREAVAIREAQTLQRSLYEYAPNSKPAADYLQLLNCISDCKRF